RRPRVRWPERLRGPRNVIAGPVVSAAWTVSPSASPFPPSIAMRKLGPQVNTDLRNDPVFRVPTFLAEGGRDQIGMLAAIKSVGWPRSDRNHWPPCVGIRSHPGKGPLDARLDSQHGLGTARVLAIRRQKRVVREPIARVDCSAAALPAGIPPICPGLVCRPTDAGRRRHR